MDYELTAELTSLFVLQLGIVLLAVRVFGRLAKKAGTSPVLGELIAGIIIGPFALGGIALPGFPQGIFPLNSSTLPVSVELSAFTTVASIILLFSLGLETNLKLFLRYSLAGSIISICGVVISFAAGNFAGMMYYQTSFLDPRCLFLGMLLSCSSLGVIAHHLVSHKKMDAPESVTILAASIFDEVLTIITLTVVLGLVAVTSDVNQSPADFIPMIFAILSKAFGIWLGCVVLGLAFSKQLAGFLKLFKSTFTFSMLALGIAMILSGIFERQGLGLIIGAYIAGLSLSKTDIAPIIQERIRGIHEFLVPVFFAVMGMKVNIHAIITPPVLIFGLLYSATAITAKVIGCGASSLLFGFNLKGAMRIGAGMSPRGEMTLVIAGIGLSFGILYQEIYAVIVFMILVTKLTAPVFLATMIKIPGPGTQRPAKGDGSSSMSWEFPSHEIANLVVNTLLADLRNEGFYVQVMSIDDGLSQARKGDIFLSIRETGNQITIESATANMPFVKTAVYEVIVELHESTRLLKEASDPQIMKKELLDSGDMAVQPFLSLIKSEFTSLDLKGETGEEIIVELVDILYTRGMIQDRDLVIRDVMEREKTMNTGMVNGIAMPHAKTDGIDDLRVAVGIKKDGLDFGSMDGEKSRLFFLIVSPKKASVPHLEFLAALGAVLEDRSIAEAVINAPTPEKAVEFLCGRS